MTEFAFSTYSFKCNATLFSIYLLVNKFVCLFTANP